MYFILLVAKQLYRSSMSVHPLIHLSVSLSKKSFFNQVNAPANRWMNLSELKEVNAFKWMQPSECNQGNEINWMQYEMNAFRCNHPDVFFLMKPSECSQCDATKGMQPRECKKGNASNWMHSTQWTQLNAPNWMHTSKCKQVNPTKWQINIWIWK
jgi:hypothetical protein